VSFSGGKAIRGPLASGILCGRRDLVGSAALQMLDMDDHFELWEPPPGLIDKSRLAGMPRHGIGRALKVSKEQIVALLTALRLFAAGAYDEQRTVMQRYLDQIAANLADLNLGVRLVSPTNGETIPRLEIAIDELRLGRSAFEVCRRLRHGSPPVYVGHALLDQGQLVIHPIHLDDSRTRVLIQQLRKELV
jgi:L-seryl-tRNA(Ser) seleniumtransferase